MRHTRRAFVTSAIYASTSLHPHASLAASPLTVRFYADVTRETCRQLTDALAERVQERTAMMSVLGLSVPPPIHLHVNSHGGSLMDGLYVYDVLRGTSNVHTHVEGMVASAATLLTVAGSHRTISPHSVMLVHQPSMWTQGEYKYELMRDEHANMEECVKMLVEIYNETTTSSVAELARLIGNEQFMRADECLHRGFVDEIL